MNTFPKTVTKVFSLSNGELARSCPSWSETAARTVPCERMPATEDPLYRGDQINRLIMQSPAIKAAKNRRIIAQRMLQKRPSGLNG